MKVQRCFLRRFMALSVSSVLSVSSAVSSVVISISCPLSAAAQRPVETARRAAIEGRVDAIAAGPAAVHVATGFTIRTGTYLRSGIDAGVGASSDGLSGRIDLVNRFHLDPFRQSRWAPYGGGGLGARFDNRRRGRAYLLVFAGLDGPVTRGLTTSLEAGLGGGGRIGMIIRRAAAERR